MRNSDASNIHSSIADAPGAQILRQAAGSSQNGGEGQQFLPDVALPDRKSTRLNSSHANISYAVFCLKKKHHTHLPPPELRTTLSFSSLSSLPAAAPFFPAQYPSHPHRCCVFSSF